MRKRRSLSTNPVNRRGGCSPLVLAILGMILAAIALTIILRACVDIINPYNPHVP
jgi:hypothetical protein